MRKRIIGLVCITLGLGMLAVQHFHVPTERVYVYPPRAEEKAIHEEIQSSGSQLIVNGSSIPHKVIPRDVSEAEAKRLREEAGYSSEGVTGGVIVELKEIDPDS